MLICARVCVSVRAKESLKARDTDGEAYHGMFCIFAHDSIRELKKVKQSYKHKHNFELEWIQTTSVVYAIKYTREENAMKP